VAMPRKVSVTHLKSTHPSLEAFLFELQNNVVE
jgi:hypothetical protein